MANSKYLTEIKEEIIEYNPDLRIITRYCVIVEQAQRNLTDLIKIWNDEKSRSLESFTP